MIAREREPLPPLSYILFHSSELTRTEKLNRSFGTLPPDQYLKGDYMFRYRRFDRLLSSKSGYNMWLPNEPYGQSAQTNSYAGGIARQFESLDDDLRRFSSETVIPHILPHLSDGLYEFGIHTIRIVADENNEGFPAPEGPHQDGNDYEALFCVSKENTKGAITTLATASLPDTPIITTVLAPGDMLIFDDRALIHYTTSISPEFSNKKTHRDIFAIGINKK